MCNSICDVIIMCKYVIVLAKQLQFNWHKYNFIMIPVQTKALYCRLMLSLFEQMTFLLLQIFSQVS